MYASYRAVGLVLLGIPLVVIFPSGWTVAGWAVLVAVLIVVDVLLAPRPRMITGARRRTESIRIGERTWTDVLITNTGRRTVRGQVRDTWQPSAGATSNPHPMRLGPGQQMSISTELRPIRRGSLLPHRVTVRVRGPLTLAGRQLSLEVPGEQRVLPAFPSRRHLPSRLARLRELDGLTLIRSAGHGTEFDSLRDYVSGDDIRHIDWRATARRRDLVVRTWQPERDRRIVMILDTSRLSAGRVGDLPRLDAAMDAVLLLGAVAARAGDHITLVAADRHVHTQVSGLRRGQLLPELSNAMAPLQPSLHEADWRTISTEVTQLSRRDSLLVLLTPLEPEPVAQNLLPVVARMAGRHRIVLASVADPGVEELAVRGELAEVEHRTGGADSIARFHQSAAAEQTRLQRRRAGNALTAVGATVVDEPPDRLPTALVDHYLLLKRNGQL
jgi:uncharacterized protein (DUF58 family)